MNPVWGIIGKGATKVLTSKAFWIVLGIIILLLILRRYWDVIGDKLKPLKGDFSGTVSVERASELEALADSLNQRITGNYAFENREEILLQILGLNDTELLHLHKYYNKYYENMIDAVNNEWLPFTDADERLISRLNGMGLS